MGTWMTGFDGNPLYVLAPGEKHPDTTNAASGLVDAHAQMLAARVEGLEKDINGLQHVWGRVAAADSKIGELFDMLRRQATFQSELESRLDSVAPLGAKFDVVKLLKRAVDELPPNSPVAHDIVVYLRNR
jgi:hypothetical protein